MSRIERDPQAHYVVGTNGRIRYAANSFTFPLAESVIIPHHKFLLWPGHLTEESCELAVQAAFKKQGGWGVTAQATRATARWKPCAPGSAPCNECIISSF